MNRMLAPNSILQNRYRIVRLLGEGGMGAVYEAIDERVSCLVALKETMVGPNTEARRVFQREAALLANLRHPSLPKVMDYFSEGDSEFLAMEFISGHDLAEFLELRGSAFPQARVLQWADDVLKVLEYLHSRKPPILHRDIKPSNLKVTKQGELFLIDFGLAKGAAGQMATLDTSRSVLGYTPVYSPLEQIHGRGTDPRSDLYALGATLYTLLTGENPLDAPTRFAAIDDEQPDPLRPAHELNPQVSPAVSVVVMRAMAISRRQRPSSAAEMRQALNYAGKEEPIDRHEEDVSTLKFSDSEKPTLGDAKSETDESPVVPESVRVLQQPLAITELAPGKVNKPPAPVYVKTMAVKPELLRPDTGSTAATATSADIKVRRAAARRFLPAMIIALALLVSIGGIVLLVRRQRSRRAAAAARNAAATLMNAKAGTVVRNPMGMELVWIQPGSFTMGAEWAYFDNAQPLHRVTISNGFYLGKYEVAQGQWQALMGNNPSKFKGDSLPVEQVSWLDAQQFVETLNQRHDSFAYRLPTEAEWEYACRAGTPGDYAGNIYWMGWYDSDSDNKTHAVGTKEPNAFGLFDMHGNVWEWCQDWYHGNYDGAPADGSAWLNGGEQKYRVLRGGSWTHSANYLQSYYRGYAAPDNRVANYGFRVVAVVRPQ